MAQIVWIASYPRSGNTWLRFLLGNLLFGEIRSSAQISQLIPDIHRSINAHHLRGSRSTLIKTHWAYEARFPMREDTFGVIYIHRNPVDVMASGLSFWFRGTPDYADLPPDRLDSKARNWVRRYLEAGGEPQWHEEGFGSWEDNVGSWTGVPLPFPRHVLSYETLRTATAPALRAICEFLRIERSDDAIAAVIRNASIENMRAMEEDEIRNRRPGIFFDPQIAESVDRGFRFVRREAGGPDAAPERREIALTDEERRQAVRRFAPTMRRLGYEVDPGAGSASS